MIEKVGKVTLNYKFYDSNDRYSDGDAIEERLLDISINGDIERAVYESNKWPILYHFSDIRANLFEWYPFKKDCTILEVGSGCGALSGFLSSKASKVVGIELSKRRSLINANRNRDCDNLELYVGNFRNIELTEKFDYVMLIGVLEYAPSYIGGEQPFEMMIKRIKEYLKPDGKILIAIENKMGLKYLNGAKEDHIGKSFAGIEDYRYVSRVRTFSKPELCKLLEKCDIEKYNFYYPVPDYKTPYAVYSDKHLPQTGELRLWNMNYDNVRVALYNDAIMADQVCKDAMFDYFSNSFLIICNETDNDIRFACYTNERKKEYQTKTVIFGSEDNPKVTKEYLKNCSRPYDILERMNSNCSILQEEYENITYLKPSYSNNSITYDYIHGNTMEVELSQYIHDADKLVIEIRKRIDQYITCRYDRMKDFYITEAYEELFGQIVPETMEKSLPLTNLDLLFSNIIMKDDIAYCIDYEWVFDFPIPYEYVIYRSIVAFYSKYNMYFSENMNKTQLLTRVGIKKENISIYNQMERKFSEFAFGKNDCMKYLNNYKKPKGMIEVKGF